MLSPALRHASFFIALAGASLLGASACSGGDGDGGGGGGGGGADAGSGPSIDAAARPDAALGAVCADVADFSDLGVIDGEVLAADGYLSIDATLEVGPPQDLFVVELYAGVAPFEAGIAAGTFEITGTQTDYNVCGVCATVFGDIANGNTEMVYVAQSGTVTVTSVAGNFSGSFVPAGGSATFVGFGFDDATEAFVKQDSCTLTGGGATWDKAIPVAPTP